MTTKLYVGNLGLDVTDTHVRALFAAYGNVEKVALATDPGTGYSKGFGYVDMGSDEEANQAIASLHGHDYQGQALHVRIAPGHDTAH